MGTKRQMVPPGLQIHPESERNGYGIVARGLGERDLKKEGMAWFTGHPKVC